MQHIPCLRFAILGDVRKINGLFTFLPHLPPSLICKRTWHPDTTTPNLHGIDATQVANHGFFSVYVRDGGLYLLTDVTDDTEAPPFSVRNGKLYYTLGGQIQYISKQVITT